MKIYPMAVIALIAASCAGAATIGRAPYDADVLEELNYMRANPADYASELDDYGDSFEGNIAIGYHGSADLMTNEGVRAVSEAARALRSTARLDGLISSNTLAQAAADHVRAQGQSGEIGHVSKGRSPGERVKARGGDIYVGEVIAYGVATPQDAIRQLIVDDGVPSRGHRNLLLSARYQYAGVACGPHKTWRTMCVIDLSETPDGSPIIRKAASR